MTKKKGMTILEILVGMTIFILAVTLAVGAFVSVSRMRSLTITMRESQGKLRIANEMISRYAREAAAVDVPSDKEVIFKFVGNSPFKARFKIEGTPVTLNYYECSGANCSFSTGVDLLAGLVDLDQSQSNFTKIGRIPPSFLYNLSGQVVNNNFFYSDTFTLTNSTIMEGLQ